MKKFQTFLTKVTRGTEGEAVTESEQSPVVGSPVHIVQPVVAPALPQVPFKNEDEVEKDDKNPELAALITNLQGDLEREYMSAIHYLRYAETVKTPEYQAMAGDFKTHAEEEFGHASVLNKQLDWLGAEPVMVAKPCKVLTRVEDIVKMLLEEEKDAIARYTTRINQAEALKLYALAQELREIIVDEQHHAIDLDANLK